MNVQLNRQNIMLALRQTMGWPPYAPANDCLAFTSGRPMDVENGIEIGRIATALGKDVIYSGWASESAREPSGFTIAYRMIDSVDIVDRIVPYVANDGSPVILISTTQDEHFAIDARGSLVRAAGKPQAPGKGRLLAMKRIKALAKNLRTTLLEQNRHVPVGAPVERPAPAETIVRFG